MGAFISLVTIGLLLGCAILLGQAKTLKVVGVLFIIGGLLQGMDLMQDYPDKAATALNAVPQYMSNVNHNLDVMYYYLKDRAELHHDEIARNAYPEMNPDSFRHQYHSQYGVIDLHNSNGYRDLWDASVPLVAHDANDAKAGLALLGIAFGFLLLRVSALPAIQSKGQDLI